MRKLIVTVLVLGAVTTVALGRFDLAGAATKGSGKDASGKTAAASPTIGPPGSTAFQPVDAALTGTLVNGGADITTSTYVVPAGKELVIEQVSFSVTMPKNENLPYAFILANRNATYVAPMHKAPASASTTAITGSQLTRIYADPGSGVDCVFTRFPATGSGPTECDFDGYLINAS